MKFKVISLFIFSILNLSFGIFVYFKNRRSLTNLSYFIFISFVALWSFGLAMFYLTDINLSMFWASFLYFMGNCIAASFFYFSLIFPSKKSLSFKKVIFLLGTLIFLFFLYFFTPHMIKEVVYIRTVKTFVYGKLHLLFDFHFIILFLLAFWKLYQKVRIFMGRVKEQARYILFSTFIGVILMD